MSPYLIEPHNPWSKTPRKKTLAELLEEEEMFYRILQEQERIAEQKVSISPQAQSPSPNGGSNYKMWEYKKYTGKLILTKANGTETVIDSPSGTYDYSNQSIQKVIAWSCPNLTGLTLTNNSISFIDLKDCTHVESLLLSYNNLSSLTPNMIGDLTTLNVSHNSLRTLNIGVYPNLVNCYVNHNQLSTFDISKNNFLDYLDISNNNF